MHLASDALTVHQAEGEVAFASGFVVGSGLTDKNEPDASSLSDLKGISVPLSRSECRRQFLPLFYGRPQPLLNYIGFTGVVRAASPKRIAIGVAINRISIHGHLAGAIWIQRLRHEERQGFGGWEEPLPMRRQVLINTL